MDNIFNIDKLFSIDNPHIVSIVKATLLLVLSISGNFLAETLSCQSQKWLENMYVKHILILFMIYFTIDFTQEDAVKDSPLQNAGKAIIVWILFHLFTHMDIGPTLISVIILMTLFFISNQRSYLKKTKNLDARLLGMNQDKLLGETQKGLFIGLVLTILVGFTIYFLEKRVEYKSRFDILKFIFGVKKCSGKTPKAAQFSLF